ncbi:hypothetical protein N7470_001642 [Penicillium chermesinum]|nr:hypothetical protein N7470_001642 [Penicillium chermesinum]
MTSNPGKKYIHLPETTPHLATILSYPSRPSTFPRLYPQTCNEIIDLASTISAFEPVRLHARPEDIPAATALLSTRLPRIPGAVKERISLVPAPTNHIWVRDTGPVYVRDAEDVSRRAAVDFRFCEWGQKYQEAIYNSTEDKVGAGLGGDDWPVLDAERRRENTEFAAKVLELEGAGVERVESRVRLEGGGIDMDGEGTLMAAESSVLVDSRNEGDESGGGGRGIEEVTWGREGLDITDCHIDAEARFVRPGVVVVCKPHVDCEAVFWDIYREIRAVLDQATDARGRRLQVFDVEEPDPKLVKGDVPGEEDMPAASYVNFYFTNGGLVMPAFGDAEADRKAFELMQKLLPEREVRQVAVNALPRTGGVLHCTTQQVL